MTLNAASISPDLDAILLDNGRMFDVIRQTTTQDSMGDVTAVSNSEFLAYGILMDITRKDRQIHDQGLAVPGNVKGFFKESYTVTSGGVGSSNDMREGDILVDRDTNINWRIEKIIAQRMRILKVIVLKNITGEGS